MRQSISSTGRRVHGLRQESWSRAQMELALEELRAAAWRCVEADGAHIEGAVSEMRKLLPARFGR